MRIDGDQSNRPGSRDERRLLEQFFRRHRDAIHDLGRAIEDFQDFIAQWAAKRTGAPAARGQFDPTIARIASRADHVTFSHALIMRDGDDRSKTTFEDKLSKATFENDLRNQPVQDC